MKMARCSIQCVANVKLLAHHRMKFTLFHRSVLDKSMLSAIYFLATVKKGSRGLKLTTEDQVLSLLLIWIMPVTWLQQRLV